MRIHRIPHTRKAVEEGNVGEDKLRASRCLLQESGDRWRWGARRKVMVQGESSRTTAGKGGAAVTRGQETATHGNKVNLLMYGEVLKSVRSCLVVRCRASLIYVERIVMKTMELQSNTYASIVTWTVEWAAVGDKVLCFGSY